MGSKETTHWDTNVLEDRLLHAGGTLCPARCYRFLPSTFLRGKECGATFPLLSFGTTKIIFPVIWDYQNHLSCHLGVIRTTKIIFPPLSLALSYNFLKEILTPLGRRYISKRGLLYLLRKTIYFAQAL